MQPLDLLILNSACDDWENLSSIRDSVESAPQGGPIESSELEACLLRLVREKLLSAHEFVDGTFVPLTSDAVDASTVANLWFFITAEGRRVLDENEAFFG